MAYITLEKLADFASKFADKITEKFAQKTDIPTSLPANGGDADTVGGHTVSVNVPADAQFTDTLYTHPNTPGYEHLPAGGSAGQVLKRGANGEAQWENGDNTTYSPMIGATADAAGESGLVPTPAAGANGKYLKGDGTWGVPPNTTYTIMKGATESAGGSSGLVPAPAKGSQSKFLRGDGTWQEMSEASTADIDNIIAGTFE